MRKPSANIQLTCVEMQFAKACGRMRTEASAGKKTQTMVSDNDYLGVCGEIAFANYVGVPWDWRNKISGDGGIDFTINGTTIDIKATRGEPDRRRLMVVEGKVLADVYVLAVCSPDTEGLIVLRGWESGLAIKQIPTEKPKNFVFFNHIVNPNELHHLDELKQELGNE